MYNWEKEISLFNRVYTFDSADADKYNYIYLPNFFIQNKPDYPHEIKYDLFFIGKFSPYRYKIIQRLMTIKGFELLKRDL